MKRVIVSGFALFIFSILCATFAYHRGYQRGKSDQPTALTFGAEVVGMTSDPQNVTFSNPGPRVVSISTISVTGDFAAKSNCNGPMAGGSFCTFSVTFTPTAAGSRYGRMSISDDAAASPHILLLSGTGISPYPPNAHPD